MPPTRIDRATRSLGITPSPASDNIGPQDTTRQAIDEMGPDGPDLSYPGSSVVTEIKSCGVTGRGEFALAQDLPEVD